MQIFSKIKYKYSLMVINTNPYTQTATVSLLKKAKCFVFFQREMSTKKLFVEV